MSIELLKREHVVCARTLIEELRSMTEQEEVIINVPERDAKQNDEESSSASHLEDNAGKEATEDSPRCGSHFPTLLCASRRAGCFKILTCLYRRLV